MLRKVMLGKVTLQKVTWTITYLALFRIESFDGSYGDSLDGISRMVGIGAVCDSITCRAISA